MSAPHATKPSAGRTYLALDEIMERPTVRVLRVLRRFDHATADDLRVALDIPAEHGADRRAVDVLHSTLIRLARGGMVTRHGDRMQQIYRITDKGRDFLRHEFKRATLGPSGYRRTTKKQRNVPGTIYLIHFEQPFKHARHYLGWTKDLEARLASHLAGRGSSLIKAVNAAGIDWRLVRTWEGVDRFFERKLKNRGGAARICPCCAPAERKRRNALRRAA